MIAGDDDWVGVPDPPETSAPAYPEGQRIRYDPRAPRTKNASAPPTIDAFPPLIPDNPPPVTGTGSPGCAVWIEIDGSYGGTITVPPDGSWVWTPPAPFPPGEHCVKVKQRCPEQDWSSWATECFTVVEVPPIQRVEMVAKPLSFLNNGGPLVPGTLAVRINGEWVYGVLNQFVEVRENG